MQLWVFTWCCLLGASEKTYLFDSHSLWFLLCPTHLKQQLAEQPLIRKDGAGGGEEPLASLGQPAIHS